MLFVAALAGYDPSEPATDPPPPPSSTRIARYEVRGFGTYPATRATTISYLTPEGETARANDVALPWGLTLPGTDSLPDLYVRALAQGPGTAVGLRVAIAVDGREVIAQERDGINRPGATTNEIEASYP